MRAPRASLAWTSAVAALLALGPEGCGPSRLERAHQAGLARTVSTTRPRKRLGWVTWPDASTVLYCNRRVDDRGEPVGRAGACFRREAGGPSSVVDPATALGRADATPATDTPDPRCTVELEDARLSPPGPARAFFVSPTGRTLVDQWTPDEKLTADAYAIEVSFSPEGRWMAVVHLAIGLGQGERSVEIVGVELRSPPACT